MSSSLANPVPKTSILFIVSAPSGTGKTSLCTEVMRRVPRLSFSISHTTRPARPGEKNGTDYYFISQEEFKKNIAEQKMAEWTEIYGNHYGTAVDTIQRLFAGGFDILFDIDERGARQLKEKYPDAITILILPPSLEELKKRLRERGTEDAENLTRRLKLAQQEIRAMAWYQYTVINDRLEDAAAELSSIITAERCRTTPAVIDAVLSNGNRREK
jgi:guanylate kinase